AYLGEESALTAPNLIGHSRRCNERRYQGRNKFLNLVQSMKRVATLVFTRYALDRQLQMSIPYFDDIQLRTSINVRRYRFSQSQCCRLQLRAVSREDEGDTKCLVRQRSRFPLQLLSASPSLRQPQLSIAVLMSIGRRAYLAKGLTTFPRHPHLVRRYARILGRDA